MKIRIGDYVKIKNPGKLYATYRNMASEMNLQNFDFGYNDVYVGDIGKVVAIDYHEFSLKELYGVRLSSKRIKRDIIIGNDGTCFYKRNVLSMDDNLFRI